MAQLSGKPIGEFIDALLGVHPTCDALRSMVRVELEKELEAIADGANQRAVLFNLTIWAKHSAMPLRRIDMQRGERRANLRQAVGRCRTCNSLQQIAPAFSALGACRQCPPL